jgi:hypothetical protein
MSAAPLLECCSRCPANMTIFLAHQRSADLRNVLEEGGEPLAEVNGGTK